MSRCAHCGSDAPDDAHYCPLCGVNFREVLLEKKSGASYKPYFFGILGIILGVIAYYGIFSGLVEDPLGIFVPALGIVFGIKGAAIAYTERNLGGNHTSRLLICTTAVMISEFLFMIYVFI